MKRIILFLGIISSIITQAQNTPVSPRGATGPTGATTTGSALIIGN